MTAKSSVEIEAELERDRETLKNTVGELSGRLSLDGLAQEALGLVKANAGAYRQSFDTAIRANPLALALTGAGLAWLIFGGRKSADATPKSSTPLAKVETLSRWEDDGGPVAPLPLDDLEEEWARATDSLRARASQRLTRIEEEARAAAQAVTVGLSGRIEKVRDFAAERAAVLADFTEHLGKSFRHGLSGMSETAQERIATAREAAYAARLKAEKTVARGSRQTSRLIEDHPMVAGAVALAIGAALGAALPRSRAEDRTIGPERDRLMREAARTLREEKARVTRLAEKIGADLKESVVDAVEGVAAGVAGHSDTKVKQRAAKPADAEAAKPTQQMDRESSQQG